MKEEIKYIYDKNHDEFYDIMEVGEAYIFVDNNHDTGWMLLCLVLYNGGYKDFDGLSVKIGIVGYDAVVRWAEFKHKDAGGCRVVQFQVKPPKNVDGHEWIEEHILADIKGAQDKFHSDKFDQSIVI